MGIDIRAVYREFYRRKPQGLNGALRELGLGFEGREHSGIEDARNTARLVWRMVQDGCQLEVTTPHDTLTTSREAPHKHVTTSRPSSLSSVSDKMASVRIGPPSRDKPETKSANTK